MAVPESTWFLTSIVPEHDKQRLCVGDDYQVTLTLTITKKSEVLTLPFIGKFSRLCTDQLFIEATGTFEHQWAGNSAHDI